MTIASANLGLPPLSPVQGRVFQVMTRPDHTDMRRNMRKIFTKQKGRFHPVSVQANTDTGLDDATVEPLGSYRGPVVPHAAPRSFHAHSTLWTR